MAILLHNTSLQSNPEYPLLPVHKQFLSKRLSPNVKRTAAQAQIQRLSPPVDEVVNKNEEKIPAKRSLKNVIQQAKTEKKSRESNVA